MECFKDVEEATNPDEKVKKLREILNKKVDEIFPEKHIKVFQKDKEFMDHKLHDIRRSKAREYVKNKKSQKYMNLDRKYKELKEKNTKK